MKYFAYGSNMNWSDLDNWCEKHGYSPIDPGSSVEPGVIRGYELIFNHYSKCRGGGALNLRRLLRNEVCGVLFELSDEDFQKIEEKEGPAYKKRRVNVILGRDRVVGAVTFITTNTRNLYPPTEKYLRIVLEGAEQLGLGEKCLKKIRETAHETRARRN